MNKNNQNLNCIRLFIVEDVSDFKDIDIGWVLACNCGGPELIPSTACAVVPRVCFSICDLCHSGNETSCHCDCQRKIDPFVGMTYNFQPNFRNRPICGNDV